MSAKRFSWHWTGFPSAIQVTQIITVLICDKRVFLHPYNWLCRRSNGPYYGPCPSVRALNST